MGRRRPLGGQEKWEGNPVGVDKVSDRKVAIQTNSHDAAHPSRVVLPVLP